MALATLVIIESLCFPHYYFACNSPALMIVCPMSSQLSIFNEDPQSSRNEFWIAESSVMFARDLVTQIISIIKCFQNLFLLID